MGQIKIPTCKWVYAHFKGRPCNLRTLAARPCNLRTGRCTHPRTNSPRRAIEKHKRRKAYNIPLVSVAILQNTPIPTDFTKGANTVLAPYPWRPKSVPKATPMRLAAFVALATVLLASAALAQSEFLF